jgi:hypothetical protein
MSRVQIGTDRYMYPFVPKPKKVQIGTHLFRGVPFVPWLEADFVFTEMTRTPFSGASTNGQFFLEQQP